MSFVSRKDSDKMHKAQVLKEKAKRLKLDAAKLPSICFYSVLNSHEGYAKKQTNKWKDIHIIQREITWFIKISTIQSNLLMYVIKKNVPVFPFICQLSHQSICCQSVWSLSSHPFFYFRYFYYKLILSAPTIAMYGIPPVQMNFQVHFWNFNFWWHFVPS